MLFYSLYFASQQVNLFGHRAGVYCLIFDKNNLRLLTGSDDSLVKVWDARYGYLIHTIRGHFNVINDIAINEENSLIATASSDGYVRVWKMENFQPVAALKSPTTVSKCYFNTYLLENNHHLFSLKPLQRSNSRHHQIRRLDTYWLQMKMDKFDCGSGIKKVYSSLILPIRSHTAANSKARIGYAVQHGIQLAQGSPSQAMMVSFIYSLSKHRRSHLRLRNLLMRTT